MQLSINTSPTLYPHGKQKPSKIVFLDRDGVINKDTHYLYKISDFEFQPEIVGTCLYLLKLNYQLIIVTNQSGIARGYYNKEDFYTLNDWMLKKLKQQGVEILDVFFCPHGPESDCPCRKPKPGMFINASNKHNIDLKKSWMIGDRSTDIEAANAAGIDNTILFNSDTENLSTESRYAIQSLDRIKNIITK